MTAEWSVWSGTAEEWDDGVLSMPTPAVHQGHRWGEHRRRFGWTPLRLAARRDGRLVAMAQVLLQTRLRAFAVAWMPGGPVGDLAECGEPLRRAVKAAAGTPCLAIRVNPDRPHDEEDAAELARQGWSKSRDTLLSGSTLHYRLDLAESDRLALLTRNWRHNLRRGQKRDVHVSQWSRPEPTLIERAYGDMHEFKGIGHLSRQTTKEWIGSILDAYGDDSVVVRCDDADGSLLAVRGALVFGDRAWDTFAAATPAGRKGYASYVAFWKLTELCAARGVTTYDMGGADPVGNRGVYDFKQGTGATTVALLGEWEHSSPRVFGALVGRRIAGRGN